jgi:hypothetical protein
MHADRTGWSRSAPLACWADVSYWKALRVGSEIPRKQLRNVRFQAPELEIKLLNGLRGIVLLSPVELGFAPQEKSLCQYPGVPVSAEPSEGTEELLVTGISMNIEVQ